MAHSWKRSAKQLGHSPELEASVTPTPVRLATSRHFIGTAGLPAQPTPLLGRERDLEQVRGLFSSPDVRLVTLTGPPGVGKTRLAVAAASALESEYAGGCVFVDLSPVRLASAVVETVASALEVREAPGGTMVESVGQRLGTLRLLLVLDNFEHVLAAAKDVADLLTRCPGLKVLSTSREALRLRWEHVLPVPPLPLPARAAEAVPAVLLGNPAVALFVERARAVKPDFAPNGQDLVAVADVCARLDGLPLAIELAAARVNMLPPRLILARLDSRLDFLTEGAVDLPDRQRALREALRWSLDLLTDDERRVFGQLAVFAGGWTLEAAEAVCEKPFGADSGLKTLASLVSKSLVQLKELPDGEARFGMLETVREFAAEVLATLESSAIAAVHDRHATYLLRMVERAQRGQWESNQLPWLELVKSELNNLRVALRWLCDSHQAEAALRLAAGLLPVWDIAGQWREGRLWLEEALRLGGDAPAALRGDAIVCVGILACRHGDYGRASELLEEGLELCRSAGEEVGAARALNGLGLVAEEQRDYTLGRLRFEQSLAIARRLDHRSCMRAALNNLGNAALGRGDYAAARSLYLENLHLAREARDPRHESISLVNLAGVSHFLGDKAQAGVFAREGLALLSRLGDVRGIAVALAVAGLVACADRQWETAVRFFAAGEALGEAAGAPQTPSNSSAFASDLASARAGLGEAAFAAAWAAGRGLSAGEAIALATKSLEAPPPPADAVAGGNTARASLLTRRELEVAVLIARGRRDHEIAAELVVSKRTAESHTASILGKLGMSSRSQIAAWVVQQGLLGEQDA